jgi:pimeloyl-ACP methyl ester carboxylesterase
MESKVFFGNGRLCGIISAPSESVGAIVLLCHGLNSHKDSHSNLALRDFFQEHNLATFRFDFFGHGESKGLPDKRTLEEFTDDILQAIAFLKTRKYQKFGICGSSFGGIAATIATSRSSDVEVMALKAPGMGKLSRVMPNYKRDFDTKSWIKAGESVQVPTLIVHGTADADVEIALGESLAKAIRSCRLERFEHADHRFTKKEDFDASISMMGMFVLAHLDG